MTHQVLRQSIVPQIYNAIELLRAFDKRFGGLKVKPFKTTVVLCMVNSGWRVSSYGDFRPYIRESISLKYGKERKVFEKHAIFLDDSFEKIVAKVRDCGYAVIKKHEEKNNVE